ncbi:MAG: TlpA family protein disulfide reductase [Bacteroidales bacterium]|nr:TlpA family protein disulfide reductase [Bacteroidales bacterium]
MNTRFFISVILLLFIIQYTNAQKLNHLKGSPFPKEVLAVTLYKENGDSTTFKKVLKKLKGDVVYLDFWASWCGPCIREMPKSKEIQKYFLGKKVSFLYLSTDAQHEKWIAGMKRIKINGHHYRIKPEDKVFFKKLFKIPGIPYYIIIDKNGTIAEPKADWPREERVLKQIEKVLNSN